MLYQCLVTAFLFTATLTIVRATEATVLPIAETFSSDLRFHSDGVEQDDQHTVVVSRGNDILTSTQTETGHYKEITVTLTAFNEKFVLDLKLNTYLFSSTYIEKAITNSGEVYNKVDHITGHCYYTGQVRDRSQSSAAVSTCKGITGYFAIGNMSYHIEPKSDQLYGRHRVYRDRDDVTTKFRCGTDKQLHWMSNKNNSTASSGRFHHKMKRSFLYPQDRDRLDKVVEVYIANDNSQYLARSSNVDNVYSRTKNIVNTASLAYQAVGIYLVLVGVEVWTDRNRFTIQASDANGALNNWYDYRKNSINPVHYNDNAILINNVGFYGGVVGKAIVGSMCSNLFSGSIISDLSTSSAATGAILAHEMGHNFGLQHDNSECSCDDKYAGNRCIMYPSTNSQRPATKWSSCSRTQLATAFNQGVDICLYNIPQTIFQASSTCGNGIVEDGEQCDCGNAPSNECNAVCCNSTTCQLTPSATCASGRCCDVPRCQLKSSGTECRSKSSDCDLAEYCNGVHSRCPADTYKPDGTECINIETAYCYEGQCRSHRSECELIWGSGTQVSDDLCYMRFNVDGAHYGNCGFRWTNSSRPQYFSCATKDVKCGKLQCQDNSKSLYYYKNFYLLSSASIGSASCHSVIFDYGIGIQDPGLVPNGAKCGDRKMCVNQKCVDVAFSPASISSSSSTTTRTTTSTTTTRTTTTSTTTTSTTTKPSTTSTSTPKISTTPIRPTSTSSTSTTTTPTTTTTTTRTSLATTSTSTSTTPATAIRPTSTLSTSTTATPTTTTTTRTSLATTSTNFSTTDDSNSTFLDARQRDQSTGQQIGLIVGVTLGVLFGLLVIILLIIFGCRYRREMSNFFEKKLQAKDQPKPSAGTDYAADTDGYNAHKNQGYMVYENLNGVPYGGLFPARQAPEPPHDAFSPVRQAPGPPNSAFSVAMPSHPQEHDLVYSNYDEISTGQPWFSGALRHQPLAASDKQEDLNQYQVTPTYLPTVAFNVPPQKPPKPPMINHILANVDANGQGLQQKKPPQLPKKPPVVFRTTAATSQPQPPPKPHIFMMPLARRDTLLPTPPPKPHKPTNSGNDTSALQPPVATVSRNAPPKPVAAPKPPTKPANFARDADQRNGKGAVESSEDRTTLSVQQLMNQFGGNSKSSVLSPTKQAMRPTPAQRKPPVSHA